MCGGLLTFPTLLLLFVLGNLLIGGHTPELLLELLDALGFRFRHAAGGPHGLKCENLDAGQQLCGLFARNSARFEKRFSETKF